MRKPNKGQLEVILAKGKWFCVLFYGVFGFGITMATGLSLVDMVVVGKPFFESFQSLIMVCPALGIGYGIYRWASFNRQYQKLS